jgi:hypothetical protein
MEPERKIHLSPGVKYAQPNIVVPSTILPENSSQMSLSVYKSLHYARFNRKLEEPLNEESTLVFEPPVRQSLPAISKTSAAIS